MKKAFENGLKWWKALPWYWKILGCIVLVLLGALWILSLFERGNSDLSAIDALRENYTDDALAGIDQEKALNAKKIAEKKQEITKRLNLAKDIDAATLERREAIRKADSMETLDTMQKEWDL